MQFHSTLIGSAQSLFISCTELCRKYLFLSEVMFLLFWLPLADSVGKPEIVLISWSVQSGIFFLTSRNKRLCWYFPFFYLILYCLFPSFWEESTDLFFFFKCFQDENKHVVCVVCLTPNCREGGIVFWLSTHFKLQHWVVWLVKWCSSLAVADVKSSGERDALCRCALALLSVLLNPHVKLFPALHRKLPTKGLTVTASGGASGNTLGGDCGASGWVEGG